MRPRRVLNPEAQMASAVAQLLNRFDYPDQEGGGITIDVPAAGGGGSAPTVVVAASDATDFSKGRADFQLTGTADDALMDQINALLTATGGRVLISEGTVVMAGNVTMPNGVIWVGMGQDATVLTGSGVITGPGEIYDMEIEDTVRFVNLYRAQRIKISGGDWGANPVFGGTGQPGGGLFDLFIDGADCDDVLIDLTGTGYTIQNVYRNSGQGALCRLTGNRVRIASVSTSGTASSTGVSMIFDTLNQFTITDLHSDDDGDSGDLTTSVIQFVDCVNGEVNGLLCETSNAGGVHLTGCTDMTVRGKIRSANGHGLRLTGSSDNDLHVKVLECGRDITATNTYDNILLEDASSDNFLAVGRSRPAVSPRQTRNGIHISTSDCDCNIVVGNILGDPADYGTDALTDAGTDTQKFWPADATFGDNFTICLSTS